MLDQLLGEALDAARTRDWPAYRASFAALRDAVEAHIDSEDELRRHVDILSAAAPEYDPEGCLAELEALAAVLRVDGPRPGSGKPGLDLRGLEPPEPIVRILDALERAPGEALRVILPHEPFPLYALLRERGFTWSGAPRADGGYELTISKG